MRLGLLLRSLRLHGKPVPRGSVHVTGWEYYRKALENARPVALLGLHAGVLELLHRVPEAPPDRPFLILTAPAFAPALTAFMAKGRERDGKSVVWNRKPAGAARLPGFGLASGLRSVVKSKGVLALMADQLPGPASETDYLYPWNRLRVPYPSRMLDFLVGNGFHILPVSTSLRADGKSDFRFHAAWDPEAGPAGKDDLQTYLRAFLEQGIAQAPEQWNWSYPKIMAVGGLASHAIGTANLAANGGKN